MNYKALVVLAGGALATNASAGPEKVQFPNDYLRGVLYQTVDRADVKRKRSSATR